MSGYLKRTNKRIRTIDDFFPNYPNDMVEVDLWVDKDYTGEVFTKLLIYGADDFILEIVKDGDCFEELYPLYRNLPEPITIEWALEHGFDVF